MASKRPTDLDLDINEYKVRGEDGKYRLRPDRGLNRIGSIAMLGFLGWLYIAYLQDILPWYGFLFIVFMAFAAGGLFTMSLKHIDW